MTSATIAVVGHVDHGKTLLVRALTGVDTDKLKDEKERGLSITLGFAGLNQDDCKIHLIDAPGHADFIRMTASGLSGASAILLVVSARDGIQKQTIEHVKLANLFGIEDAVVAITKADLVEGANVHSLHNEISALLAKFGFGTAEIVEVSGRTKAGLPTLTSALTRLARNLPEPPVFAGFFLPIDRVFSSDGAGTVVTGTLLGGSLATDQAVALLPLESTTTVRGLQVDGSPVPIAKAGSRLAVNLRATDSKRIRKADVLCAPEAFASAERIDVRLTTPQRVKHMQHVEVLHGTSHVAARTRLYPAENDRLVYAQIEFKAPQVMHRRQRFVLRDPASGQTLSGGYVLDTRASHVTRNKAAHVALLRAADGGNARDVAHKLADRDRGLVDVPTLSRLCQASLEPDHHFQALTAKTMVRIADREALQKQIVSTMSEMHAARPCRPFVELNEIQLACRPAAMALIDTALTRLIQTEQVLAHETQLALADHDPTAMMTPDQRHQYEQIESRTKALGLRPRNLFETPTPEELDLIECLIWEERLVRLFNHSLKQQVVLHADTISEASAVLAEAFPNQQTFTTGNAREALGTNRKTIVPLLEYFDRTQFTQRSGNLRAITSVR